MEHLPPHDGCGINMSHIQRAASGLSHVHDGVRITDEEEDDMASPSLLLSKQNPLSAHSASPNLILMNHNL